MKKSLSSILIVTFLIAALAGCGSQGAAQGEAPARQTGPSVGWEGLFTYDAANAVGFGVKAALPGGEEAYQYPWGGYDDPVDVPEDSEASSAAESGAAQDAAEKNERLSKALERLTPEQRAIAEEALRKAQEQQTSAAGAQDEQPLPPDWNAESNQPRLGGRLELQQDDITIILEMSEYCVEEDAAFTVSPIKTSKLPKDFLQSGFALTGQGGQGHVTLKDYAIVTFLTPEDPGEDVVIKSLGEGGEVEYTYAEVTRLGDLYSLTGALEHFSTVGYGNTTVSPESEAVLREYSEKLAEEHRKQVETQREKLQWEKAAQEDYNSRKYLETVEFDEIVFTTSAAGLPLQLHLRAKLVEQPYKLHPATGAPERSFAGKVWLKFYTWAPEGYGDMYMICNNAEIPSFYGSALTSPESAPVVTATFTMQNMGGSKSVSYEVGSFDISGKTYATVQTTWRIDPKTRHVSVTFDNMQGAAEKTFITGTMTEKTRKQANKKLKWFLD